MILELINPDATLNLIMREFFDEAKKEVIEKVVKEIAKNKRNAYFKVFKKAPYDTGLSFKNTFVKARSPIVKGNFESFSFIIDVDIETPYASAFAEPEKVSNSNFKYGERNTAKAMIDIFIKDNNL